MVKASSPDASHLASVELWGEKTMRKLFFIFLKKNLSSRNGEKAVESFLSCSCFRFFLLIPILPSLLDPTPQQGFEAIKYVASGLVVS